MDRRRDDRRGPNWVIVLISLMHITWGTLLMGSTDPYGVTPINGIRAVLGDTQSYLAGVGLYCVAGMALISMWLEKSILSLLLLLPQQSFLVMSGSGVILAIIQSHYADGVIRSHSFIAADQAIYVILAIIYPLAVLKRFCWDVLRSIDLW